MGDKEKEERDVKKVKKERDGEEERDCSTFRNMLSLLSVIVSTSLCHLVFHLFLYSPINLSFITQISKW